VTYVLVVKPHLPSQITKS